MCRMRVTVQVLVAAKDCKVLYRSIMYARQIGSAADMAVAIGAGCSLKLHSPLGVATSLMSVPNLPVNS